MMQLTEQSPISALQLTRRAENCLRTDNCETIGEVLHRGKAHLRKVPGFGKKTLNEIEISLLRHGFKLVEKPNVESINVDPLHEFVDFNDEKIVRFASLYEIYHAVSNDMDTSQLYLFIKLTEAYQKRIMELQAQIRKLEQNVST